MNKNLINKVYDFEDMKSEVVQKFASDINMSMLSRKTWEHYFQYSVLDNNGLINQESRGISFGAGRENMLYYLSNKVKEIWATDIYEVNTNWYGDANTDNPEKFLKEDAPLPFNDSSLIAMYGDMRDLSYFSDDYFDFAYSSCAISHIGYYEDFLQHLKEANRVLKPGGVYVFTTEMTDAGFFIPNPGMHMFSLDILGKLIKESGFNTNDNFDFKKSSALENFPLALGNQFIQFTHNEVIEHMVNNYSESDLGGDNIYSKVGRTQIYIDEVYSGIVLSLIKEPQTFSKFNIINNENPVRFDSSVYNQNVYLDPCGMFKGNKCFWKAEHKKDFEAERELDTIDKSRLFHTIYFAWGDEAKEVDVSINYPQNVTLPINLEVIAFSKYDTTYFYQIYSEKVKVNNEKSFHHSFFTKCGKDHACAVVGTYSSNYLYSSHSNKYYVDDMTITVKPVSDEQRDAALKSIDSYNSSGSILNSGYAMLDSISNIASEISGMFYMNDESSDL